MDKAREEMEKKKADFKAGKSLAVSLAPTGVCLFIDYCGQYECPFCLILLKAML